jgi:hypothetical protein
MLYGWTPDECLNMPATRFFAMLKAGQDLSYERDSRILMELCDVAAIALADGKYVEDLRGVYLKRAFRVKPAKAKTDALDAADPRTAELMLAMFGGVRRPA